MSRSVFARLGVVAVLVAAASFLGAAGDGGCGGSVWTDEGLCTSSSGRWGDFANWPGICAADGTVGAGPATNGEKTCACPGNQPYWQNGWGCVAACPQPKPYCKGVSKPCNEISDPAACERQDGCGFGYYTGCVGEVTPCSRITYYGPTETYCRQQIGCTWGL